MSYVKNGQLVIEVEPDNFCELCGAKDELRPYGPNGENICFDCGMKNPKATEAKFAAILNRCSSVKSPGGYTFPIK